MKYTDYDPVRRVRTTQEIRNELFWIRLAYRGRDDSPAPAWDWWVIGGWAALGTAIGMAAGLLFFVGGA